MKISGDKYFFYHTLHLHRREQITLSKMPPKKPAPVKAPVKPAAKAAPKPTGRGAPAKRGAPAAGVKRGGAAGPAAAKGKAEPAKPKAKVWTKQDEAAKKIQTQIRVFLARKTVARKRKEKQDYDELMDKIEKEAFMKIVQMEQEQADRERKKEEEERRRRQAETKRRKRMLEAAFEGDIDEIMAILQEVKELDDKNEVGTDSIGMAIRNKHEMAVIECEDPNENTPLSEAGNGGSVDTIRLLLEKGADPNTQGQFGRTPLYRAAFAGHLEACQLLLQNGADPRIYASDSQTPQQIASQKAVQELIKDWDVAQTDILLAKLETAKEQRLEEQRKRNEFEQSKLESKLESIQHEYDILQKQLNKAYAELEKRISEHDEAVSSGFDRPEITLQAIHDYEDEVEILKLNTEKAREKLANAKLELREQKRAGQSALGEDELPGVKVMTRELEDVLLRDVGNKIKDSGMWPLIIDPNAQVATFLRYRDTNYLNALSPAQMEADKARLAIIGSIRYGKPLVLDMMEVDMFDTVTMRFDEILEGLMSKIMDRSILEEENYLKIVKKSDGDEYAKTKFNDLRTKNFKFVIITKNPYPPEELLEKTYVIRMYVPT
ncbi:putative IQ motif and ankyrin repeat domain-containing protein [Mizuhopecten yessoensis]|uniref:putative IQ motif and ankyrin repeat domain-containing protein n=1 Tax=Mizuhopecten yessoensis TaxID=6573 RepID=UPI000B457A47|nr:putative IQ motif and ankyrin repeat domain-containing protein [Mizuhopecten yessoensis]